MSFLVFCLFTLLFTNQLSSQQQFGINLDRANLSVLNPANVDFDFFVSGFDYKVSSTYRGSWSALEGSPQTIILRGETIRQRRDVSVLMGAQLYTDKIGRFENNNFSAKYAVIFSDDLDERGFSVGLSANINQYRIDVQNITPENYNRIFGHVEDTNFIRPGIGLGVYYYSKVGRSNDYMYSGLSTPLLYSIGRNSENSVFKNTIHLFYNGGYIKDLQDDLSYIEFSTLTKYETTANIFVSDMRVKYNYKGNFNALIGFNSQKFLLFGFGVKQFLGYDQNLVDINYTGSFNVGGEVFRYFGILHELNLAYSFGG